MESQSKDGPRRKYELCLCFFVCVVPVLGVGNLSID